MVFHSPIDAIVPVDDARRIFQLARHCGCARHWSTSFARHLSRSGWEVLSLRWSRALQTTAR